MLENERLDLAVARGAAYYGMVRRGEGVRIAAGLARSYYIGVDSKPPTAVCLVPGSAEPGHDIDLSERQFNLLVSQPVEFPLYVSSTRLADQPGEVVEVDREQMKPLPPMRTVLRTRRKAVGHAAGMPNSGKQRGIAQLADTGSVGRGIQRTGGIATVTVTLHARLTEIGTLELWCSQTGGEARWRLQFDVRSATQTDVVAHESAAEAEGMIDEATWQRCSDCISDTFADDGKKQPERLVKRLAAATGVDRRQWPTSLLRRMWETLMELESGRRKSPVHEARWLNLLGYALRPGYGLAVDDWRVSETWRTVQGKLAHHAAGCRSEANILWRRIAGGLSAGQQRAVADPLLVAVRALHRRMTGGKARAGDPPFQLQDSAEVWRLLGSLELLPISVKLQLGDMLLDLAPKRKTEPVRGAIIWALGRLGERMPVYGPLNTVVPGEAEAAAKWLAGIMQQNLEDAAADLAVMQLARRTKDRHRDLSDKLREEAADWLTARSAAPHYLELVRTGGTLDAAEQGQVFGEALPIGLRIL